MAIVEVHHIAITSPYRAKGDAILGAIEGHALPFFKDSHKLIARGVKLFGNTKEPFAIIVANKKYYILPSPRDADVFYSNVTTLTWDGFLNDVLVAFGVNRSRLNPLWAKPATRSAINPNRKDLIHLTEDLYKKHLLPGKTYDDLIHRLQSSLNSLLSSAQMTKRFGTSSTRSQRVSLLGLCGNILIDATQMSLFDPVLFRIDPNMTAGMQIFTDQLWKLLYPSPGIDSREVKSWRQKYTKAFLAYIRLPKEARKDEAWLITTLIDQYRELGINENDAAAMMVMVYWTGDANAYKLAFWIMSYILFDPALYASIRAETRPAVQGFDIDMSYLANHCPRLKSIYYEAMRLTKRDIGIRKILYDTPIDGKILKGGNSAIVPMCQLHDNEDVFGYNSRLFDPDRFLKRKNLADSSSYKPFGGGRTYCPGRFFAVPEIFGFVALLLNRWDIALAGDGGRYEQRFPTMDESTLTLGISRPLPSDEVWVTLSDRTGG
ncbi:MAG: hypothetical protein M1837_004623 [Sclerophora amabilis]|nr:MAG: hypothetical protein M1837_004623 [Sclerophora amabilis]